jgi:predicted secreted protein
MVELGTGDDGRQLTVSVADAILVRLPESGTAGHGWDITLSGAARIVDDRIERPVGPVAGAALVRRLAIAIDAPGRVSLRAIRESPWEEEPERYAVDLDVAG